VSTRSVIARAGKAEGEFSGVYVHWDGSPHTRGPLLWKIIHSEFNGNLKAALASLIDKHPAGFSSLENLNCYCHPRRSKDAEFKKRKPEPANLFTHLNVVKGDTDIDWCFIFDEDHNRMFVRDVQHDSESIVELAEPEPDWHAIACGGEAENWARCTHYAWFHGLLPKTSNLSTQAWLGNRPLDFHDVVAVVVDGKRYAMTGTGGNSDYLQRATGQKLPSNTWISTLKARNGKRLDLPVAVIAGRDYKPFPGVIWIMPPTRVNPQETLVSA
jgi:hypothetical protein